MSPLLQQIFLDFLVRSDRSIPLYLALFSASIPRVPDSA
jgi:hypothetical protein